MTLAVLGTIISAVAIRPSISLAGVPADDPDVIFWVWETISPETPSMANLISTLLADTDLKYAVKIAPPGQKDLLQSDPRNCRRTPKRITENTIWIGPMAVKTVSVFARADLDRPVGKLEDLAGFRVGAVFNRPAADLLQDHGIRPEFAMNDELNRRKLAAGRLDYWVVSSELEQAISRHHDLPSFRRVFSMPPDLAGLECNAKLSPAVAAKLRSAVDAFYQRHAQDWARFIFEPEKKP